MASCYSEPVEVVDVTANQRENSSAIQLANALRGTDVIDDNSSSKYFRLQLSIEKSCGDRIAGLSVFRAQ